MSNEPVTSLSDIISSLDKLAQLKSPSPLIPNNSDKDINSLATAVNLVAEKIKNLQQFKEILDHTTDMIAKYSLTGEYLYVSPSSYNLFGYHPEELIGKSAYDFFHPEDVPPIQDTHQSVLKTSDIVLIEYRLKKKNGEFVWVEVKGLTIFDEETHQPSSIVCITRDISVRKKLEEEIREVSERFKEAFEHSPIGIALVSLEGKWLKVNKALTTMLGYSEDELLQKTFQDITHPDDLDKDLELANQLKVGKIDNYHLEKRYYSKDGTVVWVLLSGSVVLDDNQSPKYYIAQVVDITDQKKKVHDLELRENELARFKHAVDASFNHIIITDSDGIILFANKAATEMTGFTINEMKGHTPNLWGKQMPKEFYEQLWQAIKVEKKAFHGEIKNKKKNGQLYYAILTISPILDDFNEVIGFIGVEEDITSIKELEEMKSNFMSSAAHQLKTPLGSLRWNLELLAESNNNINSEEAKTSIANAQKINLEMIELVNDLLETVKIDENRLMDNPEKVSLNALIEELITNLQPLASKKEVSLQFSNSDNFTLMIDRKKIKDVITNLLTNATKYNTPKGTVTVKLSKDAEFIKLSVCDTGMGIPQSDLNKVSNKFYRATNALKSGVEGSGLGLYVVKKLVENWSGKMNIETELNKGTTVHVFIPLSLLVSDGE